MILDSVQKYLLGGDWEGSQVQAVPQSFQTAAVTTNKAVGSKPKHVVKRGEQLSVYRAKTGSIYVTRVPQKSKHQLTVKSATADKQLTHTQTAATPAAYHPRTWKQLPVYYLDLVFCSPFRVIRDRVILPTRSLIAFVLEYLCLLVQVLFLRVVRLTENLRRYLAAVLLLKAVPDKFIMTYTLFAIFRLFLGTLYPAYASYKAVRTKNVREYVKWMMYWIVFAAFSAFEAFADIFIAFWFPFYYEVKIIILLWLISPVSRGSLGSSLIYRNFVHPTLMKKEEEIDRFLERIQRQGYNSIVHYGSRAFTYVTNMVMQTAIRAPELLAEVAAREADQQPLEVISDEVVDGRDFLDYVQAAPDVAGPSHETEDNQVSEKPAKKKKGRGTKASGKKAKKQTTHYNFSFSSTDEDMDMADPDPEPPEESKMIKPRRTTRKRTKK